MHTSIANTNVCLGWSVTEMVNPMGLSKDRHYIEVHAQNWNDLISFENCHQSVPLETEWIFKGLKRENYHLLSTLERDIANIQGIDPNKHFRKLGDLLEKGLPGISKNVVAIDDIERGLIRRFKRQCHHYDIDTPFEGNILEWLALMRHYEAPSRLLDWTYSFYVALFFALSEAEPNKGRFCAAVWALEKYSIIQELQRSQPSMLTLLEKDEHVTYKTWKRVFNRRNPAAFVYPVNPFRLNERLVIQQGDFLCPGDIKKTFEANLIAVLPAHNKRKQSNEYKLVKCVINLGWKERRNVLLRLHRMNINKATLFPGLGGFAQSLKTLMVSPENLIKAAESKSKDYTRA